MANVTATGAKLYSNAFAEALKGNLNLTSNTVKVMLCSSTYVPNQNTHQYKDVSITGEISGTNYTNGGFTLASKTVSASGTTVTFDAADITQAGVVVTGIRYLVLYNDTPTSNKPLIAYIDLGQNVDCDGQLSINWNASGIFSVTAS